MHFHPNYVSRFYEKPSKGSKAKKGLDPTDFNHFCTRLSGLTFLINGWTECALQYTFCPCISQKCAKPRNLVSSDKSDDENQILDLFIENREKM